MKHKPAARARVPVDPYSRCGLVKMLRTRPQSRIPEVHSRDA
jgi:hypothetical protein